MANMGLAPIVAAPFEVPPVPVPWSVLTHEPDCPEIRRIFRFRCRRHQRVARRIIDTKSAGHDVVVVVSAMGDTTDELLDLAEQLTENAPAREMDMLLSAGERISMALLAMAIDGLGAKAASFTGSQAGMMTDAIHGKARIIEVSPQRVRRAIDRGYVAIVAGFQGMSKESNDITTMGRGGSDTTAVALAAALGADVCEIYTDVDGIYTADPRVVPAARKIDTISSEEMLEMAASGAKILHLRCVEYARRFGVPLHVRSSFSTNEGTWVMPSPDDQIKIQEGEPLEQPIISGVAHDRSEAKVTIVGVPDIPGKAAQISPLRFPWSMASKSRRHCDPPRGKSASRTSPTTRTLASFRSSVQACVRTRVFPSGSSRPCTRQA